MPIGVSEEHEELRRSLRRWAERYCPSEVPRALLDEPDDMLPAVWGELAEQGWLGIHVPEDLGGHGFGVLELAVVLEELGRALVPGPFLPTALAAAVLARGADPSQAKALLPGLVDGSTPACVAFGPLADGAPVARLAADGSLVVTGMLPAVLGAGLASLVILPVATTTDTISWCAVELRGADGGARPGVTVTARPCLDPTRRSAEVRLEGAVVLPEQVLEGVDADDVRDLALVLAAAELVGSARWCLEAATEHARTRVQFGRPIGQFQGVKHSWPTCWLSSSR